ncbi:MULTISPECIES: CocE/NonD family hydrolase [Rhodococcus]|uniref:CocE/NonD family hydrolase n=1 Tax=Rhodococcus oxybenzonivorans TaxID=1990687 RepID=A0AAE5A6N6_9NOCA|nr:MULTISPECIES: CocE/NonD family hydrolase [Rhodococcus]MDV7241735.1 CocE/NonD family hydrolase [Rhodococcus oxybenzonivorans]MDV7264654.1 CocE/NonD family hydrolase [Rhodococcus oxybenzonivorans]MDV7273731.1 CocE/NonD family hydrolase [Rhodococcus oxybenzonivorans]MDV7334017.1 CocE/NonD family hydrolase [Rhodococcus oxybenzonivorans]MDV7343436.1 CocE/NonD family hydrolase [Rhodococcus oxybenzonivorans]
MMIIERDVPIEMDDGIVLRADVFRPDDSTPVPVIMTLGPYGKGVPFQQAYPKQWEWLDRTHPELLAGSTRSYLTWETADPEIWVAWGYAVVRVDSRGAGRSPGFLDPQSPREIRDYYEAIEWAGTQPWSTGKVGLNGISYYAITQWLVACLQPPHLTAMVPWEGAGDAYRDKARHGGILSNNFQQAWYPRQVLSVQHGNPEGPTDPWLGEPATGPEKLTEADLLANRIELLEEALAHPLDDEHYRTRSADWSRVTVPFLSAASLAGYGLHPRGNFEAFTQAAATDKWLETHPGRHEEWFYLAEGMELQKRFLDHFLKGEDNGWDQQPPVLLRLRRPFTTDTEPRGEREWPLARTAWTNSYLGADLTLGPAPATGEATEVPFDALGEPVTFLTAPLDTETELTGPLAATLFISSTTSDADLFLTLQAFAPDGREVHFPGTIDPATPLAQGWLRASHRKLDTRKSLPYRPYHTHDELQPLHPGEIYEVQVEIWPTCIILPAGYRIALQISGHDFERPTPDDPTGAWTARGSGPFLHNHPADRPPAIYGGRTTVHTGPDTPSRLLLPIIPNPLGATE